MEEQSVGPLRVWSEGKSWPGPADIGRKSPHDGVVASEAVTVVVVVDYGDFDRHAVEIDHAVDHAGGLGCCNTLERHRVVRSGNRVALITLAHQPTDSVTLFLMSKLL